MKYGKGDSASNTKGDIASVTGDGHAKIGTQTTW